MCSACGSGKSGKAFSILVKLRMCVPVWLVAFACRPSFRKGYYLNLGQNEWNEIENIEKHHRTMDEKMQDFRASL